MRALSQLLRSVPGVSVVALAALVGLEAGCGGVATADSTGGGESTVGSTYEPPSTYMCQQHIPEGACASCLAESAAGACDALRDACDASADCVSFGQCQFECYQDVGCCQTCAAGNPAGFVRYAEYIECAVCDECALACEGLFPDLCGG